MSFLLKNCDQPKGLWDYLASHSSSKSFGGNWDSEEALKGFGFVCFHLIFPHSDTGLPSCALIKMFFSHWLNSGNQANLGFFCLESSLLGVRWQKMAGGIVHGLLFGLVLDFRCFFQFWSPVHSFQRAA